MSAKPTYTIESHIPDRVRLLANGTCIAVFRYYNDEREQAEANARAWVDGMAAMETIKRIRSVADSARVARIEDFDKAFQAIAKILDEDKP